MADINEIKLWEWCKTHGDYEGYLMRYPNGSFATEARLFMSGNSSATKPNNISYRSEREEYENCKLLSDFYAFIKKYPNGEFTTRAQTTIKTKHLTCKLGYEPIMGREEECDFKACQVTSEFEKYLEKYPYGVYREQAKAKYSQLKAQEDAWKKDRKDEDEFRECETLDDYSKFVETHQGKWARQAEHYVGALKSEPKQIIMQIVCSMIGIASVAIGLALNKMIIAGAVLLGLGLIELFAHFVMPFDRRTLAKGDNYLQLSGYLMLVGGLVFMLV